MQSNNASKSLKTVMKRLLIHLIIFTVIVACSTSKPDTINSNEQVVYNSGKPNFTVAAYGSFEDPSISLSVTTSITTESLISVTNDSVESGTNAVGVLVEIVVRDGDSNSTIASRNVRKELSIRRDRIKERQESFQFTELFNVDKTGGLDVEVTVYDLVSGESSTQIVETIIPDLKSNSIGLSNTVMKQSKVNDGAFTVVAGYNITEDHSLIEFENTITNDVNFDSVMVQSKLIKFETDIDPAKRIGTPEYSISVLDRHGIRYSEDQIISEQNRTLSLKGEALNYRVGFETPGVGNYRYQIRVTNKSGSEIIRAFDFGVKRENFPYVRTPEQMADPLIYLMDDREFEELISTNDSDSLKRKIDDFWLRNIKNVEKAERAIEMYYQRVEEANKRFTSYKEGWKTDRGMIYILFGPPKFVRTTFNFIQWSYSTDRYSDRYNYFFYKERRSSNEFPYNVYLLDRSNEELKTNEYLILQKWLTGNIEY